MAYRFSKSDVATVSADLFNPASKRALINFRREHGQIGDGRDCPFCHQRPRHYYQQVPLRYGIEYERSLVHHNLVLCHSCVWFRISSEVEGLCATHSEWHDVFASYSTQKRPVFADLPLERIEAHLARHWGDWRDLTAQQAEDVVAGIFAEHLHGKVHYTTSGVFSPDKGIDFVIVETEEGAEYAFQVKRRLTDKSERIRPIREFIGSLALQGHDRGVYVTFAPKITQAAEKEIEHAEVSLAQRRLSLHVVDGTVLRTMIRSFRCAHVRDHWLLSGAHLSGVAHGDDEVTFDPHARTWREVPLSTQAGETAEKNCFGCQYSVIDLLSSP